MHFSGSVYGLQVGSPVVFRGVRMGSVQSIGVVHDGRFACPWWHWTANASGPERRRRRRPGACRCRPWWSGACRPTGHAEPAHRPALRRPGLAHRRPARAARRRGMVEIPTTLTRFQSLQDQLDRVDLTRISRRTSPPRWRGAWPAGRARTEADPGRTGAGQASLARLSATLDRKAGPLADAAQGTLAQAGWRRDDPRGHGGRPRDGAADAVGSAASSADAAGPGSP
jgi:paraquat-inducible protein B